MLDVTETGGEGGASETAGEQGKGERNNGSDQAARCLTGNGERGEAGAAEALQRPCETNWHPGPNGFTSASFLPLLDCRQQSAQSMRSEKADHLTRRVQCEITTPHKRTTRASFCKSTAVSGTLCFCKALLLLDRVYNKA